METNNSSLSINKYLEAVIMDLNILDTTIDELLFMSKLNINKTL